jgi:hypothetical protein
MISTAIFHEVVLTAVVCEPVKMIENANIQTHMLRRHTNPVTQRPRGAGERPNAKIRSKPILEAILTAPTAYVYEHAYGLVSAHSASRLRWIATMDIMDTLAIVWTMQHNRCVYHTAAATGLDRITACVVLRPRGELCTSTPSIQHHMQECRETWMFLFAMLSFAFHA